MQRTQVEMPTDNFVPTHICLLPGYSSSRAAVGSITVCNQGFHMLIQYSNHMHRNRVFSEYFRWSDAATFRRRRKLLTVQCRILSSPNMRLNIYKRILFYLATSGQCTGHWAHINFNCNRTPNGSYTITIVIWWINARPGELWWLSVCHLHFDCEQVWHNNGTTQ